MRFHFETSKRRRGDLSVRTCPRLFWIGIQMTAEIVSVKAIAQVIYLVRGQRVLLDRDLAALYALRRESSIRR